MELSSELDVLRELRVIWLFILINLIQKGEGLDQSKIVIGEEVAGTHINQDRGVFGHVVVWTVFAFCFVFKHGQRVVLCLS